MQDLFYGKRIQIKKFYTMISVKIHFNKTLMNGTLFNTFSKSSFFFVYGKIFIFTDV